MTKDYFLNAPNNALVSNLTTSILKSNDARTFHSKLKEYRPTPLICLPGLSKKYNVGNIYVKDESFRLGLNAFKVLGASYAMNRILKSKPHVKSFCTATDGNHGRAVAWSAKSLKKEAIVYVPGDTTNQRIKVIENEGARVEKIDGNYDDACAYAEKMSTKNGWELIQDMAWEKYEEIPAWIVAGYITLFREMENSIHTLPGPKIDLVFLQAGVGSFAGAGVYYYLERYGINRPKIVVVEPMEADAILTSFKKGEVATSQGNCTTIMAGLNCGTPSLGAWDILKAGVDVSMAIDDKYSRQAIRELYYPNGSDKRVIAGESGAAGLAGFMAMISENEFVPCINKLDINQNTNILFISTEGATDEDMFHKIIGE